MNIKALKSFKKTSKNFIDWVCGKQITFDVGYLSKLYLENYFKEYCIIYTKAFNISISYSQDCFEKITKYSNIPGLYFGSKKECLEFCNKIHKENNYISTKVEVLGVFNIAEDSMEQVFLDFRDKNE